MLLNGTYTHTHTHTYICLKAFLFPHSPEYLTGLLVAILEFWIELILLPDLKQGFGLVAWVGIFLFTGGGILRCLALWDLGEHFTFQVKDKHEEGDKLITTGVYSILRHPSYTGFFWWYIGGQLLLKNPITGVFTYLQFCPFFKSRIRIEERYLAEFYPDEYPKYRERTAVLIPFF